MITLNPLTLARQARQQWTRLGTLVGRWGTEPAAPPAQQAPAAPSITVDQERLVIVPNVNDMDDNVFTQHWTLRHWADRYGTAMQGVPVTELRAFHEVAHTRAHQHRKPGTELSGDDALELAAEQKAEMRAERAEKGQDASE